MAKADDNPVRGHRNNVIGVIGRANLNAKDKAALVKIGRLIAKLNRTLATVPAAGTANAIREGVVREGGELLDLDTDVIGQSDHTFVFPDDNLLQRLLEKYPDLHELPNVTIVHDSAADWLHAIETVAKEHGVQ